MGSISAVFQTEQEMYMTCLHTACFTVFFSSP